MPFIFQLSPDDRDRLAELVNIGVSHAGTTLSSMVGHRTTITVPSVAIKDAANATEFITAPDDITVAVLLRISGGVDGYVFLFFQKEAVVSLLKTLTGKNVSDLRALDKFDRSLFQEVGNVITGGMLSGLSRFLHLHLLHSVPDVVVDMGAAMFNSLAASMVAMHEEFLSLEVTICIDAPPESFLCDPDSKAIGRMFLFIGPEATKRILSITQGMTSQKDA
jgi:chemotaxis protein CheC